MLSELYRMKQLIYGLLYCASTSVQDVRTLPVLLVQHLAAYQEKSDVLTSWCTIFRGETNIPDCTSCIPERTITVAIKCRTSMTHFSSCNMYRKFEHRRSLNCPSTYAAAVLWTRKLREVLFPSWKLTQAISDDVLGRSKCSTKYCKAKTSANGRMYGKKLKIFHVIVCTVKFEFRHPSRADSGFGERIKWPAVYFYGWILLSADGCRRLQYMYMCPEPAIYAYLCVPALKWCRDR